MASATTLDPSAWLASYGDYLYSWAVMRVGNNQTAEDLVQETFISAFKARDSFSGASSEKTWLVAILKNKIIDHYRKKDVLRNTQDYLHTTEDDFSKNFFDADNGHWLRETAPQAWAEAADSDVNQKEFSQILQLCIQKMPPKLAPVFVAKFLDEEESETICKDHNISSSNYWVIIHRAKVLIRSCLEKNWFLVKSKK